MLYKLYSTRTMFKQVVHLLNLPYLIKKQFTYFRIYLRDLT